MHQSPVRLLGMYSGPLQYYITQNVVVYLIELNENCIMLVFYYKNKQLKLCLKYKTVDSTHFSPFYECIENVVCIYSNGFPGNISYKKNLSFVLSSFSYTIYSFFIYVFSLYVNVRYKVQFYIEKAFFTLIFLLAQFVLQTF